MGSKQMAFGGCGCQAENYHYEHASMIQSSLFSRTTVPLPYSQVDLSLPLAVVRVIHVDYCSFTVVLSTFFVDSLSLQP